MSFTRKNCLVPGLALYASLSLISMATMSIGAGILALCLIVFFWPAGGIGGSLIRLRALLKAGPPSVRAFAWASLALVLACALSLAVASFRPLGFGGHFEQVHFFHDLGKLWYFAWPFLLWAGLSECSPKQRAVIFKTWLGTFMVLSAIGVAQHYTGWPRPHPIPYMLEYFHATLFLGHHLSVASILIFPFFALLDATFGATLGPREGFPCPMKYLGLGLGITTLFFTYSRTLWLALPVGLVFWAFLRFGSRGRVAIALLLALAAGAAYQVPAVRARIENRMGLSTREDLWEANWRFFKERPLTGVGLKHNEELSGYYLIEKLHTTDVFQGHAHDNVLDILSSTGLVGAAAFFAWWISLLWVVVFSIRRSNARQSKMRKTPGSSPFFAQGLLAALVVYQINGLTQVNFWEGKVQHQLMWMAAWALLWAGEFARG